MCPRVMVFGLLGLTACAAQQKFDPASPIDVRSGALSSSFEQRGQELDRGDMVDKLGERPASASDISRAKTLSVIATIAAATGGALIGWPIGSAAGGNPNPPWVLAGIGAGFVVVAIPFSAWAGSSVSSAVDAHNRSLKGGAKSTANRD